MIDRPKTPSHLIGAKQPCTRRALAVVNGMYCHTFGQKAHARAAFANAPYRSARQRVSTWAPWETTTCAKI